jgi:hypothetical protein
VGPAAGGRNRARILETDEVVSDRAEPVPRQPVLDRKPSRVRLVGEVRLPLAGPYRPRARLYAWPDGELRWVVRVWEVDRVVVRSLDRDAVRIFARVNRLPALARDVDALLERAMRGRRA